MNTAHKIRVLPSRQEAAAPSVTAKDHNAIIPDSYPILLSAQQCAELLHLSPGRVRGMCRDGRLPGIQIGQRWIVPRSRLEQMLSGDAS
jgi:excisionase family DNA binding protein